MDMLPQLVPAAALSLVAGSYVNAKLSVSTDLKQLYQDRSFSKRLQRRIAELGDTCTLYRVFEQVNPELEALWFEGQTWKYKDIKAEADRLAALLHSRGIKTGDYVAVFTTNSPEMVVAVLAISKLGAVAALINTSLRDDTLMHCVNVSRAQFFISTPDISSFFREDVPHIALDLGSFSNVGAESSSASSAELIKASDLLPWSTTNLTAAKRGVADIFGLIYTSGTTGSPKACAIKNMQVIVTSNPVTVDVDSPSKYYPLRSYSPLPLFHGTAFFSGFCYTIGNSGTLCLRRKFSASNFWKDVKESGATRILYIGELCRYLLATPPSPYDRDHQCIVAWGNGLRGEIWDKFKDRFNVPEIREFYRSTEGVAKFDNWGVGAWGVGKIGFAGPIRRLLEDDTFIVRYDTDTEMPYRDPRTGFCVRAELGEEGEVIGRVRNRNVYTDYLHNEDATEKKLLRNVFQKGDLFQRMGDLVVQDPSGWVRFHDRVGDTFRWKGENVSAGEIRDHICKIPGVQDAVVYGVKLASYDGQAGAAGITLEGRTLAHEVDFISNLYKELKKKGVPSYALPRLVRITKQISTGATFKQAKGELAKKGWSPTEDWDGDKLYWLNGTKYQKLEEASWTNIESGSAKL